MRLKHEGGNEEDERTLGPENKGPQDLEKTKGQNTALLKNFSMEMLELSQRDVSIFESLKTKAASTRSGQK